MKDKIVIEIGFSKPRNKIFPIFSWAIRLIERTRYSHVYLRWYSKKANSDIYYEASGSNVHFNCKEVAEKKLDTVHLYQVEIDRKTYFKLIKFCLNNAGKDYGVLQIVGIAYSKFMCFVTGKKVKNPFSDGRKSFVCSELIGALIEDILDKDTKLDLDIAGPRAIKELLDKSSWAKKIN